MGERGQDRDIGAGQGRKMIGRFDVRRADQLGLARINDDDFCALTQALLHSRCKHRMRVTRIGADQQHHVGLLDRIEILRSGGGAERRSEAIAGRGVTDPRARIDVVVAEAGAHQFLHQEGFFVGAARRGDAADGADAVFGLDAPELRRRMGDRFLPAHHLPGIGGGLPDHRIENAFLVVGVAPRETALDAGMAVIGRAAFVRHHANQLVALHFRLERTADAAIGAGGDHRTIGLALLDDRLFDQGSGRAGLHAGAARNAVGVDEGLI